jgi:hypothetical protein
MIQSKSILTVLLAAITIATGNSGIAAVPTHHIAAGSVVVVQNDSGNTTNSVTTFTSLSINEFRVRGNGSATGDEGFAPLNSRGDFAVAIGSNAASNSVDGILMTSIAENGRDNGDNGTNIYAISCIDVQRTNTDPATLAGAYWVPEFANALGGSGGNTAEHNANFAAAWFPYTNFLGGIARISSFANGSATVTNDVVLGSPQLVYGTHYINKGAGKSIVNLTSLGYDSRTDGILLVTGAKNEGANFALAQVNSTNPAGSWNIFIKESSAGTAGNFEEDPIAFVFIPKTNTTIISGRFLGNASVEMFSGASAQFTVTSNSVGTYELKIPGRSPTNGVLIISAEGGRTVNQDNFVSYQTNAANDGWIIQSRDCPGAQLEAIPAAEPVVSFVYVPGRTPGFTVTPTNGVLTTEAGGTGSFTVALDIQPTDDVTFPVSSSNLAEGTVSTSSLTFTTNNWNIPQTVTVTGVDDAINDGPVAYTIVLGAATSNDGAYNGLDPSDVSVINADNDAPGITVSPTSGLVTTEAGGTATFNVHLNTAPTANVTIGLSSSDTTEGTVSPASLTFDNTNWNIDQTVTVTGVNDYVDDGDIAYTIITAPATSSDGAYNGLNAADVSVSNTDNDTAGVSVSAALNGLLVVEGRTNAYTVVLNSEPVANVTVNVTSGNTSQGGTVAPPSLTFTPLNWSNSQPVTVTGADDLVVDGITIWNITNSVGSTDPLYAALPPILVQTTTLDNEPILTLPDGEMIYGVGLPAMGIDGRATIADTNTANYNAGTLAVTLTANGTSADRLEIRNTGTGAGQIGVTGANVSYGGTTIGSFSGGTGVTPLVVTFNGSATPPAAEALVRNVTFRNTNTVPSFSTRSVSMTLTHADGGASTAGKSIRISLVHVSDFQDAADHGYGTSYTGEVDCHLSETAFATPFPGGNANGLFIDYPEAGMHNAFHALMRFDNIFGTDFGQIPTNAIIVSAELMLYAYDSGEGSPLYRMVRSFDPTNDTWTSFGAGVDLDDIEAHSTFESQIQVGDAANTGIGPISTSILPDLLVWQSGIEANNGWVMPGWPARTDGTGISSQKDPNVSLRPRLRVLWVPAGTSVTKFRQNVDGYTGAVDTRIRANAPDTSFGTVTGVFIDWAVTGSTPENDEQVLFRFDNMVGTATNQIPPGSQIHGAALELAAVIGAAPGHGGNFYTMLTAWQDTDTWNTLVNGISADGAEASTTPSATLGFPALNPFFVGGYHSFDMTTDVRAWISGTKTNYGWVGLPWPNGSDGVGFGTAEQALEKNRPQLRVYYLPSIVIRSITRDSTSATIVFSGIIGNTYSVLRSATVNGAYTSIGTALVQPDGSATFTDNSPLAGAAFYKISFP